MAKKKSYIGLTEYAEGIKFIISNDDKKWSSTIN
jgi:hypothetical protein